MSGCQGCSYKGLSTAIENNYVGVRFGEETNLTLSATGDAIYAQGEKVVVDSDVGPLFGRVEMSPMPVFKRARRPPPNGFCDWRQATTRWPRSASWTTRTAPGATPRNGRASWSWR